jgi:hypothetical protein
MNRSFLALALALSVIPIAALADDSNNAPPSLTPAQRQAVDQTLQGFAQQEKQLHQQLRYQILSSLTPVHRRAVGATIGQLAIEASPDPQAAAKRLDAILSPGEQQRIMAAHSTYKTQSEQLHEQLRTQLQSELPAGAHDGWMKHDEHNRSHQRPPLDAGTLLLATLSPHSRGMDMDHHGPFMMHGDAPPPR